MQTEAPVLAVYLPTEQLTQAVATVAPVVAPKVPVEQEEHDVVPAPV